jgi:hypothetical protein
MHLRITCLTLLAIVSTAFGAAPVALVEDAPWSPDDAPRDGAAELGVLLKVAQLRQSHPLIGLVGVGDRRGIFQDGTQRGLEFAVRQGIPVVRLARGVRFCPPSKDDVFIDGGSLTPDAAMKLLGECLDRYGALPTFDSAPTLTDRQARALRKKMTLYQAAFTSRQPAVVAQR